VLALQSGSAAADAAPRWWQLHGDATQLSATVGNEQRQYMRWYDGSGQTHERYIVNGKSMPIDTTARQWIAEARIAPLPPIPAPPSMTDAPAYQAAVAALRNDRAVRAALGNPTTIRIVGPSRITSDTAKLTLAVQSAKGTLRLQAIRETRDGGWRFETIPAGEDR